MLIVPIRFLFELIKTKMINNPWTYIKQCFCICFCLMLCHQLTAYSAFSSKDSSPIPNSFFTAAECGGVEGQWFQNYGGTNTEIANSIQETSDGGFIIVGHTLSDDVQVSDNFGGVDFWVVKTNSTGTIEWEKNYGGSSSESAKSVQNTPDGGYIVCGDAFSGDGDVGGTAGAFDFWVLKLDATGNIQWNELYGGSGTDNVEWIEPTPDGGYVIAGNTLSNDGDILNNKGSQDGLVIKIDATGNIQWSKTYGGLLEDIIQDIHLTPDGGYIIAGSSYSFDGDINSNNGSLDGIVAKLDANGDIQWLRNVGGTNMDWVNSVSTTSDNGYIITGVTQSNNGDFIDNNGDRDAFILKMDADGNTEWSKLYGGSAEERGKSIIELTDGGYMMVGTAFSTNGDLTENNGLGDIWLLQIDVLGNIISQQVFGGTQTEIPEAITVINNGFALCGFTESDNGDIPGNFGQGDFWAAAFTSSSAVLPTTSLGEDEFRCRGESVTLNATDTNCNDCTYLWNDDNTEPIRTILLNANSTYSVTVTNEAGCTASDEINFEVSNLLILLDFSNPSDCGAADGSINVLPFGGTGNYTFNWSNGQTSSTIQNLTAGFYEVTLSDGECEAIEPIPLIGAGAEPPQFSLGEDQAICPLGILNLDTGLGSEFTYDWNTGADSPTINISEEGTYIVNVANEDGCISSDTIEIDLLTAPEVILDDEIKTCAENITVEVETENVNYQWSSGQTVAEATVAVPGNYGVTITNAQGCTASDVIAVVEGDELEFSLGEDKRACESTTISTDQENVSYIWSTGSNTSSTEITTTGTYSLIITDASSCTGTDDIFVEIGEAIDLELGENIESCSVVSLESDLENVTFDWSTGSNSNTTQANTTGWYYLDVSNELGCTAIDSVFVELGDIPVLELGDDISTCSEDATLTVDNPDVSFLWSTMTNTPSITVNESGTYSVTITNAAGCTNTDEVNVQLALMPTFDLGEDVESCGSVELTVPVNDFNYNWSTESTEQSITVEESGIYSVTVSDDSGCSSVDMINIDIGTTLTIDLGENISTCEEMVTLEAGTSDISYVWSNGSEEAILEITESGTYSVEAINEDGCTGSDMIEIELLESPELDLGEAIATCESSVMLEASDDSTLDYNWSNGNTSAIIEVENSDTYTVTVTAENGCSTIDFVEVEILESLEIDLGEDISDCGTIDLDAGVSNGSITWLDINTGETIATDMQTIPIAQSGFYEVIVEVGNGCEDRDSINVELGGDMMIELGEDIVNCGPVELSVNAGDAEPLWSTGATTATILVENTDMVSVELTDNIGCVVSDSLMVTIGEELEIEAAQEDISCHGESTGSIELEVIGGLGENTYLWDGGEAEASLDNLEADTYSVVVIDEAGCTGEATFVIAQPDPLSIDFETEPLGCNDEEGSIQLEVVGGSGEYEFLWNTMESSEMIIIENAGTYQVTVTDANDCSINQSIEVEATEAILVDLMNVQNNLCNGDNTGSIELEIAGGMTPYNYSWTNLNSGNTLSIDAPIAETLAAGNYLIEITDDTGCTESIEVAVQEPNALTAAMLGSGGCGEAAGEAAVTLNGGTSPFNYLWDNGNDTASDLGLSSGTYEVTVTDANECTETTSITLENFEQVSFDALVEQISCHGEKDGAISILPESGVAPFSYSWSGDYQGNELIDLGAGSYTVFVNDQNNCLTAQTIVISEPAPLAIQKNITPPTEGHPFASITVNPIGGTAPYFIQWSTGAIGNEIEDLLLGNYTVTVEDANGCMYEETIEISETTSIENALFLESFDIFPNPNQGQFNIDLVLNQQQDITIRVVNMIGQIILETKKENINQLNIPIHLSNISAGIYFVEIESEGRRSFRKINVY